MTFNYGNSFTDSWYTVWCALKLYCLWETTSKCCLKIEGRETPPHGGRWLADSPDCRHKAALYSSCLSATVARDRLTNTVRGCSSSCNSSPAHPNPGALSSESISPLTDALTLSHRQLHPAWQPSHLPPIDHPWVKESDPPKLGALERRAKEVFYVEPLTFRVFFHLVSIWFVKRNLKNMASGGKMCIVFPKHSLEYLR